MPLDQESTQVSTLRPSQPEPMVPPSDTMAVIYYLLDLLKPERNRFHKQFPKICMVHQIYAVLQDNTTVDRTLAQLISKGELRKFQLGGTGADEFALMLTEDYVAQIQQAKKEYISASRDLLVIKAGKRKAVQDGAEGVVSGVSAPRKRPALGSNSPLASTTTIPDIQIVNRGSSVNQKEEKELEKQAEVFDRFQTMVTSNKFPEISVHQSTLCRALDATDGDISTLIQYSLLNRALAVPANPHLVRLTKTSDRGGVHTQTDGMSIQSTESRGVQVKDDVAYRFAIRQAGIFVSHYLKGRIEILRMLKKRQFGDMLESLLVQKTIKGCQLPHDFITHELVGSGRATRVKTTSGDLLKITPKGEAVVKSASSAAKKK